MIFIFQSLFFLATQFLGLALALKVPKVISIEQIYSPELVPWKILIAFAVLTLLMVLMLKLPRERGFIFRAIFVLTVWWGGSLALSVWMPDIFAIGVITSALILWLWRSMVILQNVLVMLGIAGVASVFGLRFAPESIIILLIIFAVYDIIAVYKTHHMIKLARAMLDSKAIFAIVTPRKLSRFTAKMSEVAPGKGFMLLGGGDIAFPLILASSVSVIAFWDSLIVIGFSYLGLLLTFVLFFKLGKKPMPAFPPIAVMSILGFITGKFL